MYIVIKHYTKIDGSEMYDVVMDMIAAAEGVKTEKEKQPGFINMRGLVSDDGLTFSVSQYWESKDAWDNRTVSPEMDASRQSYNDFLKSIGVNTTTEFKDE